MDRRVVVTVAAAGAVLLLVAGWGLGRASAPDDDGGGGSAPSEPAAAVRSIDGVTVGVRPTRDGALAAADNYVAQTTETVVQDPARFRQVVRLVYAPQARGEALRNGQEARSRSPQAVANYARGGRATALVAARRLDSYGSQRAQVTTWTAGFSWGPRGEPGQRWFLTETSLRWDGQRWLVEEMNEADRPAPAPAKVGYDDRVSLETATFDRELRGMTAPVYGGAE